MSNLSVFEVENLLEMCSNLPLYSVHSEKLGYKLGQYMSYTYRNIARIANAVQVTLCDCQSLTLNVMISVSQFVRNSQLCHQITKSLLISLSLSFCWSFRVSLSFWSIVGKVAGVYDSSAMLWSEDAIKAKNVTHFNEWHCHLLSCPRQMKRAIFLNTFHVWWKLCLLTITLNFKYHD